MAGEIRLTMVQGEVAHEGGAFPPAVVERLAAARAKLKVTE